MKKLDTGCDHVPEAWLDGQTVCCRLAGDLNATVVPWAKIVFGRLIREHQPRELVIDLSAARHLDSAGLAVLVLARRSLPADGQVVLRGVSKPVTALLKIAHLDQLFSVEPASAVEAPASGPVTEDR